MEVNFLQNTGSMPIKTIGKDHAQIFKTYIENRSMIAGDNYHGPTRKASVCGMCYSEFPQNVSHTRRSGANIFIVCGVCGSDNSPRRIIR